MEGCVLNNFEHIKQVVYLVRLCEGGLIVATFVCMVIGTIIIISHGECDTSKEYLEFSEAYKMAQAVLILWYICFGVFAVIIVVACMCVMFRKKKTEYSYYEEDKRKA